MSRTRAIAVAAALGALAFGLFDVRARASLDPAAVRKHRTDFTVYTEASKALLEGRDPYAVTNARGWHYLYPPLFALLVAPLRGLDPAWQGFAWYLVSLLLLWGCVSESRRIARSLATPSAGEAPERRDVRSWMWLCAALAVVCPVVNTLQRGQVGIAVLYPLLLAYRVLLEGASARSWVGGGVLLALPVALKVTPALPAAVLLFQQLCGGAWRKLLACAAGGLLGIFLFFFAVPAAAVGWDANLRHLGTFYREVATNPDLGPDENFNKRSLRNQSLANGLYRLGNLVYRLAGKGPDDRIADDFTRAREALPMDAPAARRAVFLGRALLALLLAVCAARWREGSDRLGQAAVFGLACAATLPISPISWGHHYVALLPAALFLPALLRHANRLRAARAVAIAPATLVLLHYGALEIGAGRAGLLGVGTFVWCAGAGVLLARASTPRSR
jgi:hypothetical protein